MTGGSRMPTWKERENNKRRERRRRAIAAKVFAGLRLYGNYKLPKHCDNNEVLKALCDEAGWTVDPDGTTYRKGCSRPPEILGGSASASPCSSYHPSPASSSVINDGNSLIPWLRNLSSSKSIHHYMHGGGSISAPVTPPLSSPTARTPRMITSDWDDINNNNNYNPFARTGWAGPQHPFLPSPGRQARHDQKWFDMPESGPTSPTFSLVSKNPFGFTVEDLSRGGSRMCTPGQSGTCSPVIGGGALDQAADVPMAEAPAVSLEFAFGSNVMGIVKPWEGERIHEEFGSDELELTLGARLKN